MLGIELHTRRRNRLGGIVHITEKKEIQLGGPIITYGNCPQYITERNWAFVKNIGRKQAMVIASAKLNKEQQILISEATTFFIGTGHPITGKLRTAADLKELYVLLTSELSCFLTFLGITC